MEIPEYSNAEFFTNEVDKVDEDYEVHKVDETDQQNIVLLHEEQIIDTFANEGENEDATEDATEEDPVDELKEGGSGIFNDMAYSIWKATVGNAMRIQSYVKNLHEGILSPINKVLNIEDEIIARIFIGAAVIGAIKRSSFYDQYNRFSMGSAILSCLRLIISFFYPFVYLSMMFCEEIFWKKNNSTMEYSANYFQGPPQEFMPPQPREFMPPQPVDSPPQALAEISRSPRT